MVQDLYEALLAELGTKIGSPDLKPNHQNTCLIELGSGLQIQLQFTENLTFFLVAAKVGKLSPGRFRFNVLTETLKWNGHPEAYRYGYLGFNQMKDELILFSMIPAQDITSDKILDRYLRLKEKAVIWFESLKKNEIPSLSTTKISTGSGMFGLR